MTTHSNILSRRIPTDRGAWQATVSGVTESRTRLSDKAQHGTLSRRHYHPYFFKQHVVTQRAKCLSGDTAVKRRATIWVLVHLPLALPLPQSTSQ